jgi:3'(2'), 5'-bisphosphate nucleotidase
MIDVKNQEIGFAIDSVRKAAQLVRRVQTELVTSALTKDDRSPVTVADFSSQALVAHLLEKSFPEDTLIAEEDSAALREPGAEKTLQLVTHYVNQMVGSVEPDQVSAWIDLGCAEKASRFWTLDPIDGTKGFLRRDQYAVALALVVDGQVKLGVLGCPNLADGEVSDPTGPGSLIVSARGQGTWTTPLATQGDFKPLHVSSCSDPAQARLLRSLESGHTNVDLINQFQQAMGIRANPLLMDSQAKYALLASSRGDLLLRMLSPSKPHYKEKIWDQAAGSLVLEEAGGRITDLDGKLLDFTSGRSLTHNRGILASNGTLHASALSALKQIGA